MRMEQVRCHQSEGHKPHSRPCIPASDHLIFQSFKLQVNKPTETIREELGKHLQINLWFSSSFDSCAHGKMLVQSCGRLDNLFDFYKSFFSDFDTIDNKICESRDINASIRLSSNVKWIGIELWVLLKPL